MSMFSAVANNIHGLPNFMIMPWTREGTTFNEPQAGAPTSGTYVAAQRACYFQVYIPAPCTVYKLFWLNGATVGTNNFQVGLYADDGNNKPGAAILRGTSTLSASANVCQFDDITDVQIGAGKYWLAIWGSGTTATLFRTAGSSIRADAVYIESSLAGGLPATATPISGAGAVKALYVFGLVTRSTP